MDPSLQVSVEISIYDPFGIFDSIKDTFKSHLPLHNLHWHLPPRPLRSISGLNVNFKEEFPPSQIQVPKHQLPGLENTPFVKIILVKCNDNETYRNTVRKIIREWLNKSVLNSRDFTDWIILYYYSSPDELRTASTVKPTITTTSSSSSTTTTTTTTTTSSSSSSLSSSVKPITNPIKKLNTKQSIATLSLSRNKLIILDKIKADFNTIPKEDHVLLLKNKFNNDSEEITLWSEIVNKLKLSILDVLSNRVKMYENELKKLEEKKHLPGWNFSTYFVMKEALATAFEHMNLFQDSLTQYDEIEEIFLQSINTTNFSYISTSSSSSLPLSPFDYKTKDIKNSLLQNNINIIDLKCYIFSRQYAELIYMKNISSTPSDSIIYTSELLVRSRDFIIKIHDVLLNDYKNKLQVDEWIFDCIHYILDHTIQNEKELNSGRSYQVSEARGELILLARSVLDSLAVLKGWSPCNALCSAVNVVELDDVPLDNQKKPQLDNLEKIQLDDSKETRQETNSNENQSDNSDGNQSGTDSNESQSDSSDENQSKTNSNESQSDSSDENQLNPDSNKSQLEPPKQSQTEEKSNSYIFKNPILNKAFANHEALWEEYLSHSQKAIGEFDDTARTRTSDALRSQLGLAYFHKNDYDKAAQYLGAIQSLYEKQGWSIISTTLLMVYSECLWKKHEKIEYLSTALTLLWRRSLLSKNDIKTLCQNIQLLSNTIDQTISFPLTRLFEINTFFRINFDKSSSLIYFYLSLNNPFNVEWNFDNVSVHLEDLSSENLIIFSNVRPIKLKNGLNKIYLCSSALIKSTFKVSRIQMKMNSLALVDDNIPSPIDSHPINIYPGPNNVTADLTVPPNFYLNDGGKLMALVNLKNSNIRDLTITISSVNNEIKFFFDNCKIYYLLKKGSFAYNEEDEIKFKLIDSDDNNINSNTIYIDEKLSTDSDLGIIFQYEILAPISDIMARISIEYKEGVINDEDDDDDDDDGDLLYLYQDDNLRTSIRLPLSVSVQDAFKSNALFSRFSVSTSNTLNPIRILGASLLDNNEYKVEGGEGFQDNQMVFAGHPLFSTFKIVPNPDNDTYEKALLLEVQFRTFNEEIYYTLKILIQSALKKAGILQHYMIFDSLIKSTITDIQKYRLEEEIIVPDTFVREIIELLRHIPSENHYELARIIKKYLNKGIKSLGEKLLKNSSDLSLLNRKFFIDVEVPKVNVIFTVNLKLDNSQDYFNLNEPIEAILNVSSSDIWSKGDKENVSLKVFFDISFSPSSWSLSGVKRYHFIFDEDNRELERRITLIPLEIGYIDLPSIDIRTQADEAQNIIFEVDYVNNAETVLILPKEDEINVCVDFNKVGKIDMIIPGVS